MRSKWVNILIVFCRWSPYLRHLLYRQHYLGKHSCRSCRSAECRFGHLDAFWTPDGSEGRWTPWRVGILTASASLQPFHPTFFFHFSLFRAFLDHNQPQSYHHHYYQLPTRSPSSIHGPFHNVNIHHLSQSILIALLPHIRIFNNHNIEYASQNIYGLAYMDEYTALTSIWTIPLHLGSTLSFEWRPIWLIIWHPLGIPYPDLPIDERRPFISFNRQIRCKNTTWWLHEDIRLDRELIGVSCQVVRCGSMGHAT